MPINCWIWVKNRHSNPKTSETKSIPFEPCCVSAVSVTVFFNMRVVTEMLNSFDFRDLTASYLRSLSRAAVFKSTETLIYLSGIAQSYFSLFYMKWTFSDSITN